ncbi:sugar kinase [Kocuria coralli]|uniref:Sugar kinase n=1 Tax=Kocuria coralli TaxID=1461025 RepID=A0A5J5L1L5_9MICC|nr:PfkB family carbohydrate kinase [Kocuria coralli]KAA9394851.1 sugar kinase [Kocuria coralli]
MTATTAKGRVLHAGQAIVDVVMQIPALPPLGGDVLATGSRITAGGGFNAMAAARRDGAEVFYLGAVGSGPFARIVTDALAAEGVRVPSAPLAEPDTGFSVAMVDEHAERTFVTSVGAEGLAGARHLRSTPTRATDVICVSGYSLLHECNRAALEEWVPTVHPQATIVFDPSPLIADIPDAAWQVMKEHASIWTLNAREAGLAARRLGVRPPADPAGLLSLLAGHLRGTVLLRNGAEGTYISGDEPVFVPGYPVAVVDTNGAGDAHTGVLAAALAAGTPLTEAVRRANAAAALAVTRSGPATAPATAEIDAALTG